MDQTFVTLPRQNCGFSFVESAGGTFVVEEVTSDLAWERGLRVGQRLLAVDGRPLLGQAASGVEAMLRGLEVGSGVSSSSGEVRLTVTKSSAPSTMPSKKYSRYNSAVGQVVVDPIEQVCNSEKIRSVINGTNNNGSSTPGRERSSTAGPSTNSRAHAATSDTTPQQYQSPQQQQQHLTRTPRSESTLQYMRSKSQSGLADHDRSEKDSPNDPSPGVRLLVKKAKTPTNRGQHSAGHTPRFVIKNRKDSPNTSGLNDSPRHNRPLHTATSVHSLPGSLSYSSSSGGVLSPQFALDLDGSGVDSSPSTPFTGDSGSLRPPTRGPFRAVHQEISVENSYGTTPRLRLFTGASAPRAAADEDTSPTASASSTSTVSEQHRWILPTPMSIQSTSSSTSSLVHTTGPASTVYSPRPVLLPTDQESRDSSNDKTFLPAGSWTCPSCGAVNSVNHTGACSQCRRSPNKLNFSSYSTASRQQSYRTAVGRSRSTEALLEGQQTPEIARKSNHKVKQLLVESTPADKKVSPSELLQSEVFDLRIVKEEGKAVKEKQWRSARAVVTQFQLRFTAVPLRKNSHSSLSESQSTELLHLEPCVLLELELRGLQAEVRRQSRGGGTSLRLVSNTGTEVQLQHRDTNLLERWALTLDLRGSVASGSLDSGDGGSGARKPGKSRDRLRDFASPKLKSKSKSASADSTSADSCSGSPPAGMISPAVGSTVTASYYTSSTSMKTTSSTAVGLTHMWKQATMNLFQRGSSGQKNVPWDEPEPTFLPEFVPGSSIGGVPLAQCPKSGSSYGQSSSSTSLTSGGEESPSSADGRLNVPVIVEICTRLVEETGIEALGIYRAAGNEVAIKLLESEFGKPLDQVFRTHEKWNDPFVVGALLKRYFMQLPDPLIPAHLYELFLQAFHKPHREQRMMSLQRLLSAMTIPEESTEDLFRQHPEYRSHRDTLRYLVRHLRRVARCQDKNKMSLKNLAVVMAPSVFAIRDPNRMMADTQHTISLMEILIRYQDWLFSTEWDLDVPEEQSAELAPTVTSDEEEQCPGGQRAARVDGRPLLCELLDSALARLRTEPVSELPEPVQPEPERFTEVDIDEAVRRKQIELASDRIPVPVIIAESAREMSSLRSVSQEHLADLEHEKEVAERTRAAHEARLHNYQEKCKELDEQINLAKQDLEEEEDAVVNRLHPSSCRDSRRQGQAALSRSWDPLHPAEDEVLEPQDEPDSSRGSSPFVSGLLAQWETKMHSSPRTTSEPKHSMSLDRSLPPGVTVSERRHTLSSVEQLADEQSDSTDQQPVSSRSKHKFNLPTDSV